MAEQGPNNTSAENNPRNSSSTLFKRLTRLLSGPIVNYDKPGVTKGDRRDVQKYTFTSSTGREFKKKEYYNPFGSLSNKVLFNRNRQIRYTDFDQMEYMPEIASSLDIYADEITTSTVFNPLVEVDCRNLEIKEILHTLLYTVLNVDSNLFGWARSMCKYGDYYLYLDIDEKLGITNAIPLPVREIERIEGADPTNPNYIQFFWQNAEGNKGVTFENWQVSHFRIVGHDKYVPYGTSVLEPSRRIWRQLTLLEDAMMAYRIVRSPERRVFYIDVGNIPAEDVEQYIEQVKTQMKRNQVVDEDTGRVDLRYNAMSVDEDFYIPIRGAGTNTRIETLAGGQFTGDIDDVNYLRDKLFSALKVPKSYLAQTDSMEDKTTLSQKDVRFARTIQRLQRVVVGELEKLCIVHLYTLGFRDKDLLAFSLTLNNPSKIAELQELEHMRTKFDIAGSATEGLFSRRWVYQHIFKIPEQEVQRIQIEQIGDALFNTRIEEAGTLPEPTAGGLGGEDDFDLAGGDASPEAPDATEPEESGPLLAAPDEGGDIPEPGQRSDYTPVNLDMRPAGARKRHMKGKQMGNRELFKGYDAIRRLGNLGESMDHDEEKLFKSHYEVQQLINQMESRKNEGET
jgi:hypothetical protein